MICYDLEFPEWVRLAALAGADLIAAPVNWPAAPHPPAERPSEVVKVQAGAAVNGVFVVAADRRIHAKLLTTGAVQRDLSLGQVRRYGIATITRPGFTGCSTNSWARAI